MIRENKAAQSSNAITGGGTTEACAKNGSHFFEASSNR
jgi:hypothetical protein